MHPPEPKIPCLTVIAHPDFERVGERAVLWDKPEQGSTAELSRHEMAFAPVNSDEEGRTLDDPYISRRALRFTAARFGGIRIDCSESGTRVVANDDWIPEDRVFLGVEVERGVVLVLSERLALMLHNLDARHAETVPDFGLLGENARFVKVRREIARLSATDDPFIVRGAAATGKKDVARAIHDAGARSQQPFVTFSAVAEPDEQPALNELLAQATGGTFLLDVAEKASPELQEEILKATDNINVRLGATIGSRSSTRKRLDASAGPLIERLAENLVDVPPLDKRRDDVSRLFHHFVRVEMEAHQALERLADPGAYAPPWLPVRLVARLCAYEWPRNVDQLRRVAHLLVRDFHEKPHAEIGSDLETLLEGTAAEPLDWDWPAEEDTPVVTREPSEVSEIELLSALRAHRWQAKPTAAELGISPEALFSMIEKFSERTRRQKKRVRARTGARA